MNKKFDLQKMRLEIQADEAIDTAEATHLSQQQIRAMVSRRNGQSTHAEPQTAYVL